MNALLDSLHSKILKSNLVEEITEAEIEELVKAKNFISLEEVEKKLYSAELQERQKYNYYCDRTNFNWDWTPEQDALYQKEWDTIIEKMHALKDLQVAIKKAEKYL